MNSLPHFKPFTFSTLKLITITLILGAVSVGNAVASTAERQVSVPVTGQARQLLFIDSAVQERRVLLQSIADGVDVFLIDDGREGLEQIAEVVKGRSGIEAIHIVSHGRSGELQLGTSSIDSNVLKRDAGVLNTIGHALTDSGDIRLYGCNVAAGFEGRAFIHALAQMTGADVAASTNATGAQVLGGDWVLEASTGAIAVNGAWSRMPQEYRYTLAADQSFDGETLGASGGGTAAYGDFTFTGSGSANIAIIDSNSNIASGSDYALRFDSGAAGNVDTNGFSTTDGSEFALDSLEIYAGIGDNLITITGKQNGSTVETANIDLSQASSSSGGASFSGGPWDGTISFTGWDYVDEIVFTVTGGPVYYLDLDIDDIAVSAAVAPNATPTISIDNSTLGYTENAAATQIDPAATLSDSDGDADWNGGTLEVQITANNEAADEISMPDNVVGTINTSGTSLLNSATTIGTLSAGEGTVTNGTKLTITFNANATNALVQQVLRAIHYRNTSNDPGTSNRTVTFTATDKNSAGAGDTRTISVTATNDSPVITSNGGGATASTSINENTTAVTTVTATDADSGDSLIYSISGGADSAKFSINSSTGVLTFASAPDYETPTDSGTDNVYDVQVTVTDDGTGTLTDVQDIAITVNNVNENPIITSNDGGSSATVNAAENQTAVTTVTATDQDSGDTLTYSITGGADSAKFSINSSTGVLTFASAPNYESPTDSGANNVYDVQVTVTDDGAGTLTDVQAIAVTVTNANEAPVITSNGGGATALVNINENTTAVTTVAATDVDSGDSLTYSISGGADSAKFSINSSTGALTFAGAPNYESPTDSGSDNVYNVQVTVTDDGTGNLTDVQDIAITVNNVNENPIITSDGGGSSATINAMENQTAVTTVTATDQDTGDNLTYSLTGGADQALFTINSSNGVLTFLSAPNYENPVDSGTNGVYDVQVTVTDDGAGTLTDVQNIAVTVTNANEAPVITSNGGGATALVNINENTTAVTTVAATDVDSGDSLTYSISGGADSAKFSINSSTGALTFASAPNYESPTDSGTDNVYNVQVTVTDDGTGTLTDVQDIAITVNNVNENPIITSDGGGSSATVNAAENQTAVTTVTATDQDSGDTLTYSITGGADSAKFSINSSTGVLTFASAPNYESPTDSGTNGVYDVQVTVTDDGSGTLTDVQNIAVTVTNANEAPVITSNGAGATASTSINENTTAVTTVTATDVDSGDSLTYSISGGADSAKFSINSSTGVLTFASAPNYESPTDSGTNNVYDVQVTVTDDGTGTLTDTQAISVTVNNVNENPIITSDGGGSSATVNAAENQTAVTTVTATDQDSGDTLTYSITGGADSAKFSINSSTGVLTFASAPNYESPTDSGTNGVYDVQVTVTDDGTGTLTDVQAIAVTVTNANEAPVITSNGGGATASVNINENTTAVTTVAATDVDSGDSLTYSISGGADSAKFSINSSTGALTFAGAPNYESPTDSGSDNVYDVQVTVTDDGTGTLTDVQDIAVTVNNVNENPIITSDGGGSSATVNAAENQTAVTTVTATDQDSGDSLTYSISGGADSAKFNINSSTGVLTFASAPNYESPTDSGANNVYDVQVTVTDDGSGTLTDVQNIAVTVTNANEAPVITSNGAGATASTSINENTTAVTTVTATDVDSGDSLTYSISGGADAARFSINSSTGVLTFASAPDYETPTDSGTDNVYDVQVTVTDDGTGTLTDTQAIAVTVSDVNEAPVITGQATLTTPADTSITITFGDLTVTDPDNSYPAGFTLTLSSGANYSLSGDIVIPAPGYVGDLTVPAMVNDGALDSAVFNLLVTVTVGNTAPTISGTPATTVAGYVPYSFIPTANDVDGDPLTFIIANKPSWASFNSLTGELSGTPTNSDVGTTTGIVIRVSDGTVITSLDPPFDLTVTENLDIDGDGMPNDWETANGLDPEDPADAALDGDGDGLSNLQEYQASKDPASDDNPPELTPPADVTVDATGLFTPVEVGSAGAVDALDGAVSAASDAPSHFTPGAHIVTWSATDNAGNTATATQTVNVNPLVSFAKAQTVAEGSVVNVSLILNGPAVAYPVTIPYTVGGTAATDGSDHALSAGTVILSSGTEAVVSFATVDDGVVEGTEQIVITMGIPTNAAAGSTTVHTIDLVESNAAPVVTLNAEQGTVPATMVVVSDGPVSVSSMVSDPNPADVHSYDWSASDNALIDTDAADETFTFDPSTLSAGIYTVRLSVSDGSISDDAVLSLNVVATAPSLSAANDSDEDGTDDAAEGYGDSDGDGIADYLDAIDSGNVLQEMSGLRDSYLIEVDPGLRIRLGDTAFSADLGQAMVTMSDVTDYGGVMADSDYAYDNGAFDFTVEQLPVAGQSVQIVLPQQAAIPSGAGYRKVVNGLWQAFVVDADNSVASAPGEAGYCPPPGDSAYTAGLTEGDWCVQLTIEDGGPNDGDGLANNSVSDPGGVATIVSQAVTVKVSSGGGAGSLWLLTLLGLLLWRMEAVRREVRK